MPTPPPDTEVPGRPGAGREDMAMSHPGIGPGTHASRIPHSCHGWWGRSARLALAVLACAFAGAVQAQEHFESLDYAVHSLALRLVNGAKLDKEEHRKNKLLVSPRYFTSADKTKCNLPLLSKYLADKFGHWISRNTDVPVVSTSEDKNRAITLWGEWNVESVESGEKRLRLSLKVTQLLGNQVSIISSQHGTGPLADIEEKHFKPDLGHHFCNVVKQLERGMRGDRPRTVYIQPLTMKAQNKELGQYLMPWLKDALKQRNRFLPVTQQSLADSKLSGKVIDDGEDIQINVEIEDNQGHVLGTAPGMKLSKRLFPEILFTDTVEDPSPVEDPLMKQLQKIQKNLNQQITNAIKHGNFIEALGIIDKYQKTSGRWDFLDELRERITHDMGMASVAKDNMKRGLAQGEFDEAKVQLEALKEITPSSDELLSLEAKITEMMGKAGYIEKQTKSAIAQGDFHKAIDIIREQLAAMIPESPRIQKWEARISDTQAAAGTAEKRTSAALARGAFDEARRQVDALAQATPRSLRIEELNEQIGRAQQLEEGVSEAVVRGDFGGATTLLGALAEKTPTSPRLPELEQSIDDTRTAAGTAERNASAALERGAFDEARRIVREELAAVIPGSPRVGEWEARISDTRTAAGTAERNASAALARGTFDEARRIVREELAAVISESPRVGEWEARISDTRTAAGTAERNASAVLERGAFDEARRIVREELAAVIPGSPRVREWETRISDMRTAAGTAERNASAALERGAFDEARRIVREELAAVISESPRVGEWETRISDHCCPTKKEESRA